MEGDDRCRPRSGLLSITAASEGPAGDHKVCVEYVAVASFVHDLKIATHNFMKARKDCFPDFVKWERGYCALTYAESEKQRVINYIINQKKHHRVVTVRDELITQLRDSGVEFDESFI